MIGGFHFISVFDYDNDNFPTDLVWLYRQMKLAQEEDPEKPIFVFGHCYLQDTCYGSFQVKRWEIYKHEYHWTTNNLCHILNRFPQAVFFSGHTHFPVADERSIWQGDTPQSIPAPPPIYLLRRDMFRMGAARNLRIPIAFPMAFLWKWMNPSGFVSPV
ncbi:MAG: hypothetical protein SPF51_01370 [Candidatus Fimivicinus sp.]|nr:hypothetical protein [Oscillospiraceae bacterium]MDY5590182.1 hypothetical protein [Candidatus Fimivicinus sp.]